MTALVSVRRRNTWIAAVVGVVALVVVPVAAVVAGSAITRSTAAVNVSADEILEIPPTPVGVVAIVDDQGSLTAITAFAVAPGGVGGTVVSVPVGARVRASGVVGSTMAATGGVRLGDVYADEGVDEFRRDLAGLLNTTVEFAEVLTQAQTRTLLTQAGLTRTTVSDVFAAVESPDGEAELERWVRVGEVWSQIAQTWSWAPTDDTTANWTDPVDLGDVIEAVFRGPVGYHHFSVTPVLSTEANPDLLDLYDLDRSEVVLVMASVAPSAVVAANPSISVQIDSAFDFAVTRRAVAGVLFVGANVLLVRQLDEAPPQATQVRTSVRLSAEEVETFETLFGDIEIGEAEQRVEGIDVQIRLGTAFAETEDNMEDNTVSSR
jgi:hypothetical protein